LPVVITDPGGRPTQVANLPFESADDARVADYVARFDQQNPPVPIARLGHVHYGQLPVGRRLKLLGILQFALLVSAVAAGVWAYRAAGERDRDRLWVAMARESAHQLGTPLMSANAWVDRLLERGEHTGEIAGHLLADLDRLHRVAQRFERIGRPARLERVALGTVVERIVTYFTPRLPRHANPVRFDVQAPTAGPYVLGDAVLLEWALEALVRNALDALSGRGGTITLKVGADDSRARVVVRDDGPGIPPEVRSRLFEPGVTTKSGGWGIGLALARRIAEDVHDGGLTVATPPKGAEFILEIPLHPGTDPHG
jgi:signal transduction histidine kinase